MAEQIKKGQPYEKLGHTCGTRQGLQTFIHEDGTVDGFCFSCNTVVKDPYGDRPPDWKPLIKFKTPEEIKAEVESYLEYGTVALPDRKLTQEALEYFEIKIGVSEQDGLTPVTHHYPYKKEGMLSSFKHRVIDTKQMWTSGDNKEVDPFGWDQAKATGAKRLYIVEGELDAASLWLILKNNEKPEYRKYNPAVISVPHGAANAAKDLARKSDEIRRYFKEIVLVLDADEPGQAATKEVLNIFPEAMVANLPCKDANECLTEGRSKAAYQAVKWNCAKPKNTRLVWGADLHEVSKEPAEYGVSWPWPSITDLTRGIRKAETIYLGAAQKMGKSEIVNALAAHLIKEHNWKVLLAKPEEANKKSYKLLAGKIVGKKFHDPKVEFDEEAYDRAGEIIKSNVCMLDLYQHMGWDTLKGDIRAAAADGVDAVFIDPITNLTNGMSSGDANTKLQEIAQELAAMAKDLNIVIFIFCHLRNPEAGPSHDRGGKVLTSQFAGSRAMGRSCNYMFGLEGNKDPDLDDNMRNIRQLVLLDDREFGEAGSVTLRWDKQTTLFKEVG